MKRSAVNSIPSDGPYLEVLDHANRPVGVMPQNVVHRQKLKHHRAAALVYWPEAVLLISRRSSLCPDSPLCWDVTLSEHVHVGDSGYETVRRGLYARLGLAISKLRLLRSWEASPETDNEILTVYLATLRSEPWIQGRSGSDDRMLLDSHEVGALVHNFPGQVSSTLRFLYKLGAIFA
ncbi:MAG: hypothetical protein U5L00_08355 [Desulfovermiculus sp.]|nr:hypothetical protein [Desulfovermiculus sp.]